MILNIRHTGIVVDDLDASLDFYINKLGFVVSKQMDEHGMFIDRILGFNNTNVATVKMILNDGSMLELLDFKSHKAEKTVKQLNDIGLTHIAFTVDDVDEMYSQFITQGVEFISNPQVSPDGYAKVVFCKAPEGTYIELVELLK